MKQRKYRCFFTCTTLIGRRLPVMLAQIHLMPFLPKEGMEFRLACGAGILKAESVVWDIENKSFNVHGTVTSGCFDEFDFAWPKRSDNVPEKLKYCAKLALDYGWIYSLSIKSDCPHSETWKRLFRNARESAAERLPPTQTK
jgi:hypothetical protein